jgi:peptide/nickel transport system permease protein
MLYFILKRLLYSIPLLLGITFFTLLLIHLSPGNPLDEYRLNPQISPQTIKLYEKKFGLDKPIFVQYFLWLKNILKGDFGYSFSYKVEVKKVILSRALNTLILSLSVIFFTWLWVIPLGVVAVLNRNKFIDKILSFFSYLGVSSPTFFLAFLFLYLATFFNFLPLGGMRSVNFEELNFWQKIIDLGKHLIIPTLVLSIGSISYLQRIMRANLLEVLGSSYILSARAKGLSKRRIIYIHALKNALNPMITIFGYQFSVLLSGAALVEIIVGWPGLGRVILEGFQKQDLYLVMASMFIGAILLILGNLIADILLAYFDPRIRYQE